MRLFILWVLLLFASIESFIFHLSPKAKYFKSMQLNYDGRTRLVEPPTLYPAFSKSIGAFQDPSNDNTTELECFMVYNARVNGTEYGIGYPIDTPVGITYFERGEIMQVESDYPRFDKLYEYIRNHLSGNDVDLINSALVMTMQGNFASEELNEMFPLYAPPHINEDESSKELPARQLYGKEYQDLMFSKELDEPDEYEYQKSRKHDVSERSSGNDDEEEGDDEYIDDEENDDSDDDSESQEVDEGPPDSAHSAFHEVPKPELSEDELRELRLKHKVADRVIGRSVDLKLMGSFYFEKKVYHLVQFLEPIIVIGKRTSESDGDYLTLDDEESNRIRPILDRLVTQHTQTAPVMGVHGKQPPKYSTRASDLPVSVAGGDKPIAVSKRADGRGGAVMRKVEVNKDKKPLTAFQAAQRNWYAQKAATNSRPGLSGYAKDKKKSTDSGPSPKSKKWRQT